MRVSPEELNDTVLTILTSRMYGGCMCTPLPSQSVIRKIAEDAIDHFIEEPSLLRLSGAFTIVGDLHGNIDDLLRVFESDRYPPETKYLFLGDYVDRGANSVEVILLLFTLKLLYPEHVYLVRGNHECEAISSCYGFKTECLMKFDNTVFDSFISAFSHLPYAALLNEKYLCLHGGISPSLNSLKDIEDLPKPMMTSDSDIACGVLWSDPRMSTESYGPSERGAGYLYNPEDLNTFLKNNNITTLIRSHEFCQDGFTYPYGDDNTSCVTIFSTSDYCGLSNDCSIARVDEDQDLDIKVLKCLTSMDKVQRRVILPDWVVSADTTTLSPKAVMRCPIFDYPSEDVFQNLIEYPIDSIFDSF